MSLDGRVAVITGATGGLGRVAAAALAARGARLALFSNNAEHLETLVRDLNLPDDRWLARAADLRSAPAVRDAAQAVVARFGRVDVLLHMVGGWIGGRAVPDVDPDDIHAMLQQHLWTTVHLTQALVPSLVANRWGRVIVVSSPEASQPPARRAPYAVGKAAQEALILTLAQELRGTGVTANVLLVRAIDEKHERDQAPTPQNASWTTPEEITAAILHLCSDEAHVTSGARIPLHGAR